MKNRFSHLFIGLFIIIDLIALISFVLKKIDMKLFLLLTAVCVCGIVAQKISINKGNNI